METRIQQLEQEIQTIKARNIKVEQDKAWETSLARKISIAALTYIIVVLFFYTAELSHPRINALVPTIGFLLSTISINLLKNIWIKNR